MKLRWAVLVFGVLALTGCTAGALPTGSSMSSPLVEPPAAAAPLAVSYGAASYVAPALGMWADVDLRVVGINYGSAAAAAGVQVGDVLLDLTWIPSDAFPYTPLEPGIVAIMDSSFPPGTVITGGTVITNYVIGPDGQPLFDSPLLPPWMGPDAPPEMPLAVHPVTPVASYVERKPIPFTEWERIMSLVGIGVPLKLRLLRGDQVVELTITPAGPRALPPLPSGEVRPTVTPLPETYYYY